MDGAASQFEKALAVAERQIGGDREQTAETQAHLAAIYMRAGRTSAARELLIHAIGVLRKKDERLEFALETMAVRRGSAQPSRGSAAMARKGRGIDRIPHRRNPSRKR